MKLKEKVDNTEVKFVLDSAAALQGDFALDREVVDFFKVTAPSARMKIWYLDTADQDLHKADWLVRYRYHENFDFELTYKKRMSEAAYKALVDVDLAHAFSKKFEPEIDMGYSKKTYSLSYIKRFSLTDDLIDLDVYEAKRRAIKNSPQVFTDWNGLNQGFIALNSAVLYGPVEAVEYTGKYADIKVTFEIWKLDDYFSEISLDIDTDKSTDMHGQLLTDLKKMRLVLPDNTLKTKALFDYYSLHKELLRSS